ncbi:hypothetical protein OBA44_04940 [Bacteroidota bacterium]|nr:hypothetical protein [Bacteroidota bacterium]
MSDININSKSHSPLIRSLQKAHRNSLAQRTTLGLWNAGLVGLALFLVLLLLEQQFYLAPWIKGLGLAAIATTKLFSLWWTRRQGQQKSFEEFYRQFSRQSGLEELRYAVDLMQSEDAKSKVGDTSDSASSTASVSPIHQAFIDAAILQNLEQVPQPKLSAALDEYIRNLPTARLARQRLQWMGVLFVLGAITAVNFSSGTQRLLSFWQSYEQPNPYRYTVFPGNTTVEQGAEFTASIGFEGTLPDELILYFKTDIESKYRSRLLKEVASPINASYTAIYVAPSLELNNALSYYLSMDGFRSPIYRVDVQNRPRFLDLLAVLTPPRYTGLPTDTLRYPFAQLNGYQGTQVELLTKLNKPVEDLQLFRSDQSRLPIDSSYISTLGYLPPDTPLRITSLQLEQADTLRLNLKDTSGLQSSRSEAGIIQFVLNAAIDAPPQVSLLEPVQDLSEVAPTSLPILYRASDDHGLGQARLRYILQRPFAEGEATQNIPLGLARQDAIASYTWTLDELALRPKDELLFWIEVRDNDGYNGPKWGRSEERVLRIPSLTEFFDDIGKQEDEVSSDMEDISESFEAIQERYDEFKENLIDQPEGNYEQQVQLESLQEEQQEIEERIKELNEKFEAIKEELSEKNLLSEETLKAYEELEQLMKEIDDPTFREALEQLRENLQQMNPEQMRQALEDVEFNEERYKERLERSIELFKQLKLTSDLEKLARSYEELAKEEAERNGESEDTEQSSEQESTQDTDENSNETQQSNPLTEQQKQALKEELDRLQEQNEALSEQTTPKNEQSIQELQEFSKEKLEEIKERLQQESQPNLQQDFEELAQKTREQMQMMGQQQLNVNIAALQYILQSLLNLSLEQEKLVTATEETENQSQAYVDMARQQQRIEQVFNSLADSLYELSTEIPQFANRINEQKAQTLERIQSSLTQMIERQQNRASLASRQSFGGLNELSYELANLMDQLQNSQSGSGSGSGGMSMQQMMEQMQQMGEQQQQMNQQIQDMINDMQGDRLTQDQSQRLEQLSRQQNAIRKQLQEMQQNGGLEAGDELGSQLERMIEDMEETINDLRGGVIDPILIERQQNILTRMLQAEDALQERDEEERREGTTAEDPLNRPTPPMSLEELEQRIRQRLNDPNFTPFAPDYQRLIQQYFELLQQQQVDS